MDVAGVVTVGVSDETPATFKLADGVTEVAVGWKVTLEVLEGFGLMVEVGFWVGDPAGFGVCVGRIAGFEPLVLEPLSVGELVSGGRENEVALGGRVSTTKLTGTGADGDPCVRLKPIKAMAAAIRRKLNPKNQRAFRI